MFSQDLHLLVCFFLQSVNYAAAQSQAKCSETSQRATGMAGDYEHIACKRLLETIVILVTLQVNTGQHFCASCSPREK